jgi:hypothetical protein
MEDLPTLRLAHQPGDMVLILPLTTTIMATIVEDFRISIIKLMENVVSVGTIGSPIQENMKRLEDCTQPVPSLTATPQDKLFQ